MDDAPAIHLEHEFQLLQEKNIRLRNENALLKDQIYDQHESKNNHLKTIAESERTLTEERNNYRQLLQIMVETTEENAELSVQLDKSRESTKELENEVDNLKSKMSCVEGDFKKLLETLNQQEATMNYIRSKNHQIKCRYTKYKSAFHKLSAKLSSLCPQESTRQKVVDLSIFEGKTRTELSNCAKKIVENEINSRLRGITRISGINSDELKRLKTECGILREKYLSREKQFTHILKEARVRVLNLQELAKTYQTKIDSYEERITFLDRENKEMRLKKEIEITNMAAKKLSDLEEEKSRLQSELDHAKHKIETSTQHANTLPENRNADHCSFSAQQKEATSVTNVLQSPTEASVVTSNSINPHSVLHAISLTTCSDTTSVNVQNSSGGNPKGNLQWVNDKDEKQAEHHGEAFNVTVFNGSGPIDSHSLRRTLKWKMMQANNISPPKFNCDLCSARCGSVKTLKKHKEKTHMRAKGGTVTKVDHSHRTTKDYHR